jgi:hypothetical protein
MQGQGATPPSLTLFAPSLLDEEASNANGMLAEYSHAASSRVSVIRGVGCDSCSLFGIVDCPLLAHATVMMMVVGWMASYRHNYYGDGDGNDNDSND